MKYFILCLVIFLSFSCKKKKNKPVNEPFDTSGAVLLHRSNFSSDAHTVSGCVSIYQKGSSKIVYLEGFKTDNGPDLKVYISTSNNTSDYSDLGNLKANEGDFYYTLDTTNTTKYNHVLIWCKQYSVLFGNSQFK